MSESTTNFSCFGRLHDHVMFYRRVWEMRNSPISREMEEAMSEHPRQALLRTMCHCDKHINYDPLCAFCRSRLEQTLETEKHMEYDGSLSLIDVSLPPQPTEQELREYFDRKRREAGGR